MEWVLGIDTSNYTTSLCALAVSGNDFVDARKLLPVEVGKRGLRQSDALFFHVQRLPVVMDQLVGQLRRDFDPNPRWGMVGVSVRPRPQASSYMPVFAAGRGFADTFTRALGISGLHVSHQEGHIAAAQFFLDMPGGQPFFAVHISGGTSDVLYAQKTKFGYLIETIGEGADLHAGQFVDRVGVALGLPFPAGPALEALAGQAEVVAPMGADSVYRLHSSVRGAQMSFSGPCAAALRAIDEGIPAAQIAQAVQIAIANSLVKAIRYAHEQYPGVQHCVIAGGVASNEAIRQRVMHRLRMILPDVTAYFPPVRFASDNALGVATLAKRFYTGAF